MAAYLFIALSLIIFSSSHVSFAEWAGIGLRWTELFLHTKGFGFMPGRKQYKLQRKPPSGGKGNLATSSTVFFNSEQSRHLHLPVSLLGLVRKSTPWSVPFPIQSAMLSTQGMLAPLWGQGLAPIQIWLHGSSSIMINNHKIKARDKVLDSEQDGEKCKSS